MTDRLTTLAVAFGALALFLLLFVHGEGGLDRSRSVPRPTTEERGSGYRAASSWLTASGIRTVSLRERFDTLSGRRDLAPAGNVLVVTLPGTENYRGAEGRRLQQWIRAGNTLIVLAALSDNPEWSAVMGGVNVGDLNALSGLDFNKWTVEDPRRNGQGSSAVVLLPNRPHAYFAHVGSALAQFDPPAEDWSVRIPYDSFMLSLGHEREALRGVLWTRLLGSGRIVVCGVASLFTDKALPLADNAQLFANMMGTNLGRRGAVIFDDFHQGLSAVYDPEKFYRDPRLYLTSAILLAVWFIWVLGATRLRIPVTRIAAPREADLVRAHGGFLARVLPRDAAARRLVEHFLRRVAKRMPARAAPGDPWDYLRTCARIAAQDLAQLRRWHAQACSGERVPLVRLHNLILRIDRQMA
jgi:Domain of unknown function (DUF4350)